MFDDAPAQIAMLSFDEFRSGSISTLDIQLFSPLISHVKHGSAVRDLDEDKLLQLYATYKANYQATAKANRSSFFAVVDMTALPVICF